MVYVYGYTNLYIINNHDDDKSVNVNAYNLDIGIDDKGRTLLIECNDAYALGCYGLNPIDYAKFISARWAQLFN